MNSFPALSSSASSLKYIFFGLPIRNSGGMLSRESRFSLESGCEMYFQFCVSPKHSIQLVFRLWKLKKIVPLVDCSCTTGVCKGKDFVGHPSGSFS